VRDRLEPELNASLEAKVALTVVAAGEVIAEAGQLIIRIHEPDCEVLRDGDVNAAPIARANALLVGDLLPQIPVFTLHALA
jgi:hypothetical protein